MPTAIAAIALEMQQHVEPPAWDIVAQQAVIEINEEISFFQVGNMTPLHGVEVEGLRNSGHNCTLSFDKRLDRQVLGEISLNDCFKHQLVKTVFVFAPQKRLAGKAWFVWVRLPSRINCNLYDNCAFEHALYVVIICVSHHRLCFFGTEHRFATIETEGQRNTQVRRRICK